MERRWEGSPAPRRRSALAGLAAAALVAGALLARGGVDEPAHVPVERPTAVPDAATPLGSWRALAAPPVPWSRPPRVVWTGREALVWSARASGAPLLLAYDPAADRWREAARPPISARALPVVAWTGPARAGRPAELIVWGGLAAHGRTPLADGAAYDPVTDRWRMLPDTPLRARATAAAGWNGSELLIAGGIGREIRYHNGAGREVRFHDGAAYDPASDAWRPLAGLPPSGRLVAHTTTGGARRLAIVAVRGDRLRLLRYNHERDRWRDEDLALPAIGHRTLVAAGDRLVLLGGRRSHDPVALVWNGPGSRRALTADELPPRGLHAAAWTGEHAVMWGGYDEGGRLAAGVALDPRSGAWRPLAAAPLSARTLPGVAWTGHELLVIGGTDARGAAADGAAWRPAG